ncbi:39S ribosomal protein L2, mitochondrial isoform X3 [Synchiropus splendidus]|uniref:39S ribosomal protein L2, mitochondrial isoform X3 n=1 Tax=Synchiropus splendidus TaxID=270530 RepID=UPI00237E1A03|nr:39S ribosomal protein L2, mitochondrial isoform X3 [Synchiropus splendidus]
MAVSCLTRALRSLTVAQNAPLLSQVVAQVKPAPQRSVLGAAGLSRGFMTTTTLDQNNRFWKIREKYTVRPIGMRKTGGRDHTGRIRTHGIGGGHKQRYRIIDFHRLRYEPQKEGVPFEEKVVEVRYDPCSKLIRCAVSANEGDAYPLGALPVGTLINNLEVQPGKGSEYIRAAGTSGVLLRKVNGTAIVQLPSKLQVQVQETCMVTVGRVSNIDHNKRIIGKAGRNRWLGKRPSSGLWQRKGGWAGRKIKPLPPMKSFVNIPSVIPK